MLYSLLVTMAQRRKELLLLLFYDYCSQFVRLPVCHGGQSIWQLVTNESRITACNAQIPPLWSLLLVVPALRVNTDLMLILSFYVVLVSNLYRYVNMSCNFFKNLLSVLIILSWLVFHKIRCLMAVQLSEEAADVDRWVRQWCESRWLLHFGGGGVVNSDASPLRCLGWTGQWFSTLGPCSLTDGVA